jgi:hypothetical protein
MGPFCIYACRKGTRLMQTQSCVVQKLATGIRADTTGLIPDVQILYRPRMHKSQKYMW